RSHRPMLRWQLAAGTDGAHVEICHDHACTRPIATLDVAGTSVVPTDDLPPGVVFWRLRSRTGGTIATAMSPTWEFTVGARSAPVSTSTGTILDVNGDGYADVAVGDPTVLDGRGRVLIFLGSAAGLATTPTMIIPCPDVPAVGF